MIKHILYSLLILISCNILQAQCAFKQYHKIGNERNVTVKIIEDIATKCTYTLWDSTIDSASYQTSSNTEIWVVKNDSCGNRLWKKNLGYEEFTLDFFMDIIFTPDSALIVIGYSTDVVGGGIYNGTIFKIDREGNVLWKKAYGGRNGLVPSSVVYNPYRNTYVISGRIERISINGLWNRGYIFEVDTAGNLLNERDIILNKDSITANTKLLTFNKAVVLSDSSILGILTSQQADSIYLIKLTPNLEITWIKKPFADIFSPIRGVAMNIDFNNRKQQLAIYTGAIKKNDSRSGEWIIILDSVGNVCKSNFITDVGTPTDGMSISKDEGYLFWGDYLMRLDTSLQFQWKKTIGINESNRFNDAIQLKSGAYIGAGISVFRSNNQYNELFIMQSHPNGAFVTNPEIEQKEIGYSIYPNPSSTDIFTISGTHIQPYTVKITDATGKQILHTTTYNGTIDVSGNPNGMYYVRVEDKDGNVLLKQALVLVCGR